MNTPIEITEPASTTTPRDLRAGADEAVILDDRRARLQRLEDAPIPTPPDRCTLRPICAQEPTVAHVSTIVPDPTWLPILT